MSPATAALLLACAAYWAVYRLRARTLAAEGRPVPRARQASFAAGLVVLAVALGPPLDRLSDQLLVAHMIEHLLIGDIAALLLVLGTTGPLLSPLLRLPVIGHLRALAHPVVAIVLWAANFYAWHLPGPYQAALRDDWLHALEHTSFLILGVAMWMALLGPLPKPAWFGNAARLGYIIGVRLAGSLLGNVFLFAGTILYPYYRPGEARWGLAAGADQVAAGSVMMIEESLLTIGLFCWLFLKAAREGDERQALLDLAAEQGVELSEGRASRAVAAGRGDDLRERIRRTREGAAGPGA